MIAKSYWALTHEDISLVEFNINSIVTLLCLKLYYLHHILHDWHYKLLRIKTILFHLIDHLSYHELLSLSHCHFISFMLTSTAVDRTSKTHTGALIFRCREACSSQ